MYDYAEQYSLFSMLNAVVVFRTVVSYGYDKLHIFA